MLPLCVAKSDTGPVPGTLKLKETGLLVSRISCAILG